MTPHLRLNILVAGVMLELLMLKEKIQILTPFRSILKFVYLCLTAWNASLKVFGVACFSILSFRLLFGMDGARRHF